jgi:uncharacterized membrane protein YphA (DoxX/SURF4 family)
MPEQLYPWMHLFGRIFFSMIFIASGMNHLMKVNDTAAYAKSKGVPAEKPATLISGLLIVVGGALVVLGWHRLIGAGLLVIFLVPTSFMMHGFWRETDPMVKANEMAQFMKNMALVGAALFIAYYAGTEWPMSLGG